MADVSRTPVLTISASPPTFPEEADLWWSTVTGQMYIWFNDGNTTQWVVTNRGSGEPGAPGTPIFVGETPPSPPGQNALWWNSSLGEMFVWYFDGSTGQWVPASPGAPINTIGQTFTVEGLPPAELNINQRTVVSDATSTTFFSVVIGGGANRVPVFCDGVFWRIG